MMITRREMLAGSAAAAMGLGLGNFPRGWAAGSDGKRPKILMFTKSFAFEHSSVSRKAAEYGPAEQVLMNLGQKHGFDVTATKDGSLFTPENIAQYDAFFFYTQGDLSQPGKDGTPPISAEGKQAFLEAIENGKGFIGTHSASDTYHSDMHYGPNQFKNQPNRDPYIEMIGGEFIRHGPQQEATMRVVDNSFPGLQERGKQFRLHDEWYSLKNFAEDMHVLLVQETKGMQGSDYHRPPYPATWARRHGKGRVFYTSMGHREDVWTKDLYQELLLGALSWVTARVNFDPTPNLLEAAPQYAMMPPVPSK